MLGAQAVRLSRRVQRIREEQQSRDEIGLVGGEESGLPAAIGLAAEKDPSRHDATHRGDRLPEAGTVGGGAGGRGRAGRTALAERQIAAQHGKSGGAERFGRREEERRAAITAGAMRQYQPLIAGAARRMQKTANPRPPERE